MRVLRPLLLAGTAAVLALSLAAPRPLHAQPGGARRPALDSARVRQLYVSKDTADLAGCGANCDRDIAER